MADIKPTPTAAARAPIKKPPRKPDPKPPGLLAQAVPWLYIMGGVLAIAWLLAAASPEKELKCENRSGASSLLAFGTCTTE